MEKPPFVSVPAEGGPDIQAAVATREGVAEIELNGVPHVGVLLGTGPLACTIAVMTPEEAIVHAGKVQTMAYAMLTKRDAGGGTVQ